MLINLLSEELYNDISRYVRADSLTEVRLRRELPLSVNDGVSWRNLDITASKEDIEFVIGKASNYSLYSINECLVSGYIPCRGGVRVGVVGEGVREGDKLTTIKDIAFVAIRLPRQIAGLVNKLKYNFNNPESFIIISPPGGGKTTLLREMIKKISDLGHNCMLLDERMEISGISAGERYFDVGKNTDIASNIPKTHCMEHIIRAMRPDFVMTDEIFKLEESECLLDAIRSGIKIGATIHGRDATRVKGDKRYAELLNTVTYVIILTDNPIGKIVYEGNHKFSVGAGYA